MKDYRIDFFQGVGPNGQREFRRLSDVFRHLARNECPVIQLRHHPVEIRDLVELGNGSSYRGVIGKLRQSDLPMISGPRARERRVPLNQGEGLLEKNHFLFVRRNNLLVWQVNKHGCGSSVLGEYLSDVAGAAVDFADVIRPEALERLLRGDNRIRKFEMKIARPTNPELLVGDGQDWGPQFDLMREARASTLGITISGNGHAHDERRYLHPNIGRRVIDLFRHNREIIKSAKVTFERQGDEELRPIDLIADSVSTQVSVQMDGHYPVPESMFAALDTALRQQRPTLRRIFNEAEAADD